MAYFPATHPEPWAPRLWPLIGCQVGRPRITLHARRLPRLVILGGSAHSDPRPPKVCQSRLLRCRAHSYRVGCERLRTRETVDHTRRDRHDLWLAIPKPR